MTLAAILGSGRGSGFGAGVRRHLGTPSLRRRWIVGAVVGGLSLLPLVGTLGYENAFLLSPLFSLLGVAVGVDGVRALRGAAPTITPVRALARHGGRELAILLGLALLIEICAQLWQRNCDPWGGLGFFAMGPVLGACMGWVAGLVGGVLRRRRWAQLLVGISIPLASTLIGLWRLWADPVIFAFDPFWGYFSGAIYDEDVAVGPTYLSFRAYNLLAAAAVLGLGRWLVDAASLRPAWPRSWARALPSAAPALVVGGLALWIGLRGAQMGFTADIESITEVLSATRQTEHFIIHYAPRSATARSIDVVAAEHELAWAQLSETMGGRAPQGKVRSFVFVNRVQKRQLMGAGNVQVAAPWRQQIYLDERGYPHPVLPHELAHVFGRTVGDRIFGVSMNGVIPNVALVEGFATALAPRAADNLDLHDQATVLERLGKRPPLPAIMGPAFFTRSSSVAYTTAGSFCLWLIETRGFDALATLYRSGGDFQAAYGEALPELEAQWLAFLEQRPGVTEDDVHAMEQRYRRTPVFQRPCAHRAAVLVQEVGKARARGQLDRAVLGYRELCELEPERPEHRLGLAHDLAVAEDFDGALAVLDEAMAMPDLTVTIQALVLERRADVALQAGALPLAAQTLQEALTLPLTEGQRRGLLLKAMAAADADLAPHVVEYFGVFDPDAEGVAAAVRRTWAAQRIRELPSYRSLGSYLMARQLLAVQLPHAARPLLEDTLIAAERGRGLPPGPEFLREARLMLVEACVQVDRFEQADAVLDALAAEPGLGNGHRLTIAQWRARVAFYREYFAGS